jgi:recombinational DNA repair protein (RecF pathway)
VTELFGALGEPGADPQEVRLAFSIRALSLVGMAPELEVCAISGARCPPGQSAYFDPDRGAIVRQALGGRGILLNGRARATLALARTERWVDARFAGPERQQARALLEAFVAAQVR